MFFLALFTFIFTYGALWDHQIYLCGDNDLEYFSIQDLDEAWTAFQNNPSLANDVRMTVLFDRAASGVKNAVDDPLRHLYRSNGQAAPSSEQRFSSTKLVRYDSSSKGWKEVNDMGSFTELDLARKNTLRDFISQTVDTSSQYHFLEFWNHGAAYYGFGVDSSSSRGSHALLSLQDLTNGIRDGLAQASGFSKYTVIGFDACLMSNYAVMNALGDYTDYFLVSEEVEPGYGWNYVDLSTSAYSGTTDPAKSYPQHIMHGFFNYGSRPQNPRTLSLIETDKFVEFHDAFLDFVALAHERITKYDVDIYDALKRAATYSKKVNGAGIDLGEFIEKFQEFLPPACTQSDRFNIVNLQNKYEAMFVDRVQSDNRYTGMSIYWPDGGSLTRVYNGLPDYGQEAWKNLISKLDSVSSSINSQGVRGWCLTGQGVAWDGKNFTMADIDTSLSGGRVQIKATLSSQAGETYADYGVINANQISVYGSTDGVLQSVTNQGEENFRLTVEWDGMVTYIRDGSRSAPLFTYSTYNTDDIVKTVPLIYYPRGVTPSRDANNNYLTAGGREATLYITTAHGTHEDVTSFALYAGSDESAGAPKAEVHPDLGGSIAVKSYTNTFERFHISNQVTTPYLFSWGPTTEIIQRKAIGNQVWYVRGTAVTGDMYVYTIEEVRENGQGVRTGKQRLEDYPNSGSSGATKDFPVGITIGVVAAGCVALSLMLCCGVKPEQAMQIFQFLQGQSGGNFDFGDQEMPTTHGGEEPKEAVRPTID